MGGVGKGWGGIVGMTHLSIGGKHAPLQGEKSRVESHGTLIHVCENTDKDTYVYQLA